MKTSLDTRHVSRRQFLRLAGLTTGGLLAQSVLASGLSASARGGLGRLGFSGRVGVLLPASTRYPDLARNFLAGLQVAAGGGTADLVVRETGTGAANAYEAAQPLLAKEGISRIVGMIDPLTIAHLRGGLEAHQATLLAVSLGANLPRLSKADARVTVHSLDLAEGAAAFGAWAAGALGRTAVLAAACYDSGYDAFAAFRLGFENAGGTVRHTAITHQPTDSPDLAGVMRDIARLRPDFVYAAYSGPAAVEWMRAYQQAGLAGAIPLAGGPFLTDEALLAAHGAAALGVLSVAPAVTGPATADFARAGRPADLLALLGYETARLLAGQPVGSRVLTLREVQRQGGSLANVPRDTLATPGITSQALAALRSEVHSGWLHPYLGG
jgi:branched-chain amino acid transport system substrate-binding protein